MTPGQRPVGSRRRCLKSTKASTKNPLTMIKSSNRSGSARVPTMEEAEEEVMNKIMGM